MPGVEILAEARSLLAFVDQDPAANWAPRSLPRVGVRTRRTCRFDPGAPAPFNQEGGPRWQLAYRAATVADAAIAVR